MRNVISDILFLAPVRVDVVNFIGHTPITSSDSLVSPIFRTSTKGLDIMQIIIYIGKYCYIYS